MKAQLVLQVKRALIRRAPTKELAKRLRLLVENKNNRKFCGLIAAISIAALPFGVAAIFLLRLRRRGFDPGSVLRQIFRSENPDQAGSQNHRGDKQERDADIEVTANVAKHPESLHVT